MSVDEYPKIVRSVSETRSWTTEGRTADKRKITAQDFNVSIKNTA